MRGAGHFLAGGVVLSALAMSCPTADAQTPYIIDQNRIDRVAPHPEMPLDGLRDREGVANATPERQLPEPAPTAHAPLATIALHGSSLPSAELQSAWQVEIGRAIDSAMIERISGALANIYRESDIALFTIVVPTQDFSNGAIEFRIIEGRVSSVLVQTDDQDAADIERIRAYADPLVTEEPLSRAKLERQLSFIRDIPGQKIEAAFTPIAAGRSDVRLTITARRNHADIGVSLSNRPTPLLGDSQASV
ncbi:MAG: POTRA domain-containing protein, partial [Caulobacterales bacterium]